MISIFIPSKNNPELEKTLSYLKKIKKPEKTEIIVIDASNGKLDYIRKKFPEVKWFDYKNKKGKKITIPEQKNVGLKNSKGDIIVIIGADCFPQKNWLIELIKPLRKENEFFVLGNIKSIKKDPLHEQTWKDLKGVRYLSECGSANTAFKKEVVNKVGRLDENFDFGSDVDFSWRVIKAGFKIRYVPKAVIYISWGNSKQEIKRAYVYGIGRIRLYKKHPDQWRNLFGYDLNVLIYPLYILSLPLTLLWFYYPLLILIPIIKNINKSPIRIVFFHLIYGFGVLKEIINFKWKGDR